MDVLPDGKGPKHPVLASVLMGILRALDDDSTGQSSSDDNIVCRPHDRRQPPCRRLKHQKSSEVETENAQEYVLSPDEQWLSPTEDFPIPDPIPSPTESPKLHTIIETDEEGTEGVNQKDRWMEGAVESVEEKKVHTTNRDAIKHLQKEAVRVCSSTSSPLVTSDDSDVAAFLSKHEYATLFGAKGGNADKILIPSRFVQDYGETATSNDMSPLKRSSKEELEGTQCKKQKAEDIRAESPPKTPKRKLESFLNDAVQEFDQSLGKSGINKDATEVSGHDASSSDRETGVQHSYDTYETGSSIGSTVLESPSQTKRLKTSEEESEFSSGETLYSDIMSNDTMEESSGSSILDERQMKALGRRKKKLTKTLKSLRIDPQDVDGMSDFSSDGQTGTLKASMIRSMPGPKVRLGNYGWTAAKNDAKSMLQKAVSTSLEDFSDVISLDHPFSTAYSDSRVKTDASDTIGSGSLRQVSNSDGASVKNVLSVAVSDTSELLVDPSKSSSVILSVEDMSEKKYKSETSDTTLTSSDFKSVSSLVSTPTIQLSNPPSEGTSEITNENAHQEYVSSKNESHSTVEDLGHIESSNMTGTEIYSDSVMTSSDKLETDSPQSSEQKTSLQSSNVSSKLTSATSEEKAMSPATLTTISYGSNDSSLSDTTELSENVEASSSDSFASTLNTASRSGTTLSKQSGIDPRDLPTMLRTGTDHPLNDFYVPPMHSDASNTSSNASTYMQSSSKTDEISSTQNTFQPLSDVNSTSVTSSSTESSAVTASESTTLTESSEGRGELRSVPLSDVYSTSITSSSAESRAVTVSEATTLSESSEGRGELRSVPLSDVYSTSITSSSAESSAVTASEATTLTESSKGLRELRSVPLYDVNSTSITSSYAESSAVTASEAIILTESSEYRRELGSKQSGSFESSNYSTDNTTGESTNHSSLGKSITTSLASRTEEEESTTDFAEDTHVPLSNINLTDALLRNDPSLSDLDDSDTLTSSSDEYITNRLMQDTLDSHNRGFPKVYSSMEAESIDIESSDLPIEDNMEAPIEVTPSMTISENEVKEGPFVRDVNREYLPVLLEDENEESSDDSHTQIGNGNMSDDLHVADELETGNIEETSALQQPSPAASSSEISTSNDEHTDHLLIIDLDKNEKAFDDILMTNVKSFSSVSSANVPDDESKPENVLQTHSFTSSESIDTNIKTTSKTDEYTAIELSYDVAHYVIINAVATVFTEIIVNVAITRLTVEQDLSLQMERALFPGTEVDSRDEPINIHWISPPRYRQKKYAESLEDTDFSVCELEQERKRTDSDEEMFSLCLERALFPCLADSEEGSTGGSSSRSESTYHSLPEEKLIANVDRTDEEIESTTSKSLITIAYSQVSTIASRVSTMAVVSISQMWSIMTHLSWTIWNYIRDNIEASKVKRKDESTQYDDTVTTVNKDSGRSEREVLNETDEVGLHILASRIVTSAVTRVACREVYAMSSEQSFPHKTLTYISNSKKVAKEPDASIIQLASSVVEDVFKRALSKDSERRADSMSTTPPNGMVLAAQKSDEDYRLRLSASTVVETAVSNALVIHDSIRESASATPTELSTQSENMSVSSERGSIVEDISACSLSDIPLSSITFMRQQLADMRDIFLATVAGTMADLTSTPALAPIPTASSVVSLETEDEISAVGELLAAQKSDKDYRLRLSASTAVETAVSNALVIHDSIRESASGTPTELSTHSENMPVSSERGSIDDDISACSLSDIPLSSITFMRQQLSDMRDISISHITSTPAFAPIQTTDAELSSSHQIYSVVSLETEDEVSAVGESVGSLEGEAVTADEGIIDMKVRGNADIEETTTIHSHELHGSRTTTSIDDHTSEHVFKDVKTSSGKQVKPYEKSNGVETEIVDSALESRQDETSVSDVATEMINKTDILLPELSISEQQVEEIVDPNDTQESDTSSTSSSALSLSDVPLSGITYIREQLANVKTLANSIMDDFNSYAVERTLVAKRSSQLTCSAVKSHSSCDSARTIGNNSSNSSMCLNLHGESKLGEIRKCSSDKENSLLHEDTHELPHDVFVHQEKGTVFSQINDSLERANENCNAKTNKDDKVAQSDTDSRRELNQLAYNANESLERQAELDDGIERHSEGKATKEAIFESRHTTDQADGTRTVQMTETHQTRQLATFSRNSPSRRRVISRRKGADHPDGSYSGESSCSTDYSSSIVSRSSSSFSDGTSYSGSKRVTIESESQGKGRTDVSCRISDRGIWVNTAFLNEIDDDTTGTSITANNENTDEKCVKNKIKINVKVSPSSRKKHHSHRVRSGVRDRQLRVEPAANQKAITILDNETLLNNRQEVRVNEVSVKTRTDDSRTAQTQAYDELTEINECQRQSNRSSFKHEVSDRNKYQATQMLNKLTPKKNCSLETQCSDESGKVEEEINFAAGHIHTKRECLSDGAVSENHQFLNRKQLSLRRKSREPKPQNSACHSCVEKCAHPDDLLAAPVISRSERTRAVLSMLDDVADNLSLDPSVHDGAGRTHTMDSFRKLFASRKNKRRKRAKTPDQSPRVLSDSSVTESDGESGSPDYNSDSSRTPRSHSAVSLLNNVLRNLSGKRTKKRSKGASPGTSKGSRVKKGSVPAFDEMLGDLDDDCFIDDAFPQLVSTRTRDSPSEDNTSLNEVLQDLIEEWSFEGLEERFDFSPKSFVDRVREKLNLFMAEVRKEKRKAELRFGRGGRL